MDTFTEVTGSVIEYKKQCPQCGKDQIYKNKKSMTKAYKNNSWCLHCRFLGKTCSDETKQKISASHMGMKKPWSKARIAELIKVNTGSKRTVESCRNISASLTGKRQTPAVIEKRRLSQIGHKCSDLARVNMSLCKLGKKKSEETKRRMRVAVCRRYSLLGIGTGEDKGAKEWFSKYNEETNSNFRPTKFIEAGYYPDGYDENKHIWIEYDTKYHKFSGQRARDLIRQNNIIRWFEGKGEPLSEFKRVLAYDNDKLVTVYRGYEYA
jgi:predicted RNA-binding Zn-ribbon protein involved in translation (DUF1610 family)